MVKMRPVVVVVVYHVLLWLFLWLFSLPGAKPFSEGCRWRALNEGVVTALITYFEKAQYCRRFKRSKGVFGPHYRRRLLRRI